MVSMDTEVIWRKILSLTQGSLRYSGQSQLRNTARRVVIDATTSNHPT